MTREMFTANGKPKHSKALKPNVAIVEGSENGVPFRVYMKDWNAALEMGRKTAGTVTLLSTGERFRLVQGYWREVV